MDAPDARWRHICHPTEHGQQQRPQENPVKERHKRGNLGRDGEAILTCTGINLLCLAQIKKLVF